MNRPNINLIMTDRQRADTIGALSATGSGRSSCTYDPVHRSMREELAAGCLGWVAMGMPQANRRPSRKPQQPMNV